jgi:hypothetical protein
MKYNIWTSQFSLTSKFWVNILCILQILTFTSLIRETLSLLNYMCSFCCGIPLVCHLWSLHQFVLVHYYFTEHHCTVFLQLFCCCQLGSYFSSHCFIILESYKLLLSAGSSPSDSLNSIIPHSFIQAVCVNNGRWPTSPLHSVCRTVLQRQRKAWCTIAYTNLQLRQGIPILSLHSGLQLLLLCRY